MANDTLSMSVVFPVCRDILDEMLIPIHYGELTLLVMEKLGVTPDEINLTRQKEDVREKLAKFKQLNCIYIGSPFCYYIAKDWFTTVQPALFNADLSKPYEIRGNVASGINGAYEVLMRFPYMITKNHNALPESRAFGAARGLVIEHHVSDWFKRKWPDLYLEPDNKNQWDKPCNHDFKMTHGSFVRPKLFDVWGPNKRGYYTKPKFKKSADIHLQCKVSDDEKSIIWESVFTGKMYNDETGDYILPELGKSPVQMAVWLNCLQNGIPYDEIKNMLKATQ